MAKQGQPSRKMMANYLLNCSKIADTGKTWAFRNPTSDTSIETLRFVWLQGEINQCEEDASSFLLVDTSGSVQVIGCKGVPSGCDKLCNGLYVMVIGELKSTASPVAVVKAVKIQDLNDEPYLREIWPLEVQDQHRVLMQVS